MNLSNKLLSMKASLDGFKYLKEGPIDYFQSIRKRKAYVLLATVCYFLFLGLELVLHFEAYLILLRVVMLACFILASIILTKKFGENNYQDIIFLMTLVHNIFHVYMCCRTGQVGYLLGMVTAVVLVPIALEMTLLRSIVMMIVTLILYNIMELALSNLLITELVSINLFISVACAYALVGRLIFLSLLETNNENRSQLESERSEVVKKNIQLLELGEIKSKLLAVLSHDIRGPLVNIKSLYMLKEIKALSQTEISDLEGKILQSTDVTIGLLEDILHWSKSQISGETLSMQLFNLNKLVNKVFSLYSNFAKQKDLNLINQVPAELEILSDPAIIEMVLRNLVYNSIKFTDRGYVSVSGLVDTKSCASIFVSDSGIGMQSHAGNSLRTSTLGTNGEKGTGLGLAICNDYLMKLQGKLQVMSNKNGDKGTTVLVNIPAC